MNTSARLSSSSPLQSDTSSPAVELWGGVECTVNRVGDVYFDQLDRSGHATRLSDLYLFAGLGIRALRYPVLWERVAPNGVEAIDWTRSDERLSRLGELDVRPIVGLASWQRTQAHQPGARIVC
jgi:dTDP-4-dehydrorhamnose reductase